MSLFCRHNRFVADCPICSKGTVLDPGRASPGRSAGSRSRAKRAAAAEKPAFSGPSATSPTYEDDEGHRYVVRMERVPGGVRLAEWAGSTLRRRAPVLPGEDLARLVAQSEGVVGQADAEALVAALRIEPQAGHEGPGVSKGRSGDFKEELRIEAAEDGEVRVGRWVLRPVQGWQLQDAPPMLPAKRYAEALAGAVRCGLLPTPS